MLVVRLPRRGHWPQARFVITKHTGFAAIRISQGISVILTLIYLMRRSRYGVLSSMVSHERWKNRKTPNLSSGFHRTDGAH